jgi:deazaflavin-dependent oxidoreductase (nitroreductase family)
MKNSDIPAWRRPIEAIASSKPGAAILRYLSPLIDRPLMRLSGGRFALTLGLPTLLLTTTGRKSGEPRSTPLLYLEHEDGMAIIGTSFGSTSHPAWYLNLMANPEAEVLLDGEEFPVRAREATDEERTVLWDRATRTYSGFEQYKGRVGERSIPILVLTRV